MNDAQVFAVEGVLVNYGLDFEANLSTLVNEVRLDMTLGESFTKGLTFSPNIERLNEIVKMPNNRDVHVRLTVELLD